MDSKDFVEAVKIAVRDTAVNSVIKTVENPPGRRPSEEVKSLSQWYLNLDDVGKDMARQLVAHSVDSAVFGFLAVIDGVRAIESGEDKGQLELYYLKGTPVRLNEPREMSLHQLYKLESI